MKSLKYALLISILFIALVLPSISAATFDNIKSFDKNIGDYGKVTIKDWFGLQNLETLELKKNTDVCINDCSAEKEIILYQRGALIDDVRFLSLYGDEWVQDTSIKYTFYIRTKEQYKEIPIYQNGTVLTTRLEDNSVWEEYDLGDEVEPGTYYIKLEGEKRASQTLDWQITSQGKLIDDWAVWSSGLNDGLVYYYNMTNNAGNIMREAVFGLHNGTINGATTKGGKIGNGLNFDGVNDYVNVTQYSNFPFSGEHTIGGWFLLNGSVDTTYTTIKIGAPSKGNMTKINYDNFNFGWGGYGTNNYCYSDTGNMSKRWVFGVAVYNGTTGIKVYVNGSLSTECILPNLLNIDNSTELFLSMNIPIGPTYFKGMMDEVFVYNRTLSDTEISNLYNNFDGLTYEKTFDVGITLNSPDDYFNSSLDVIHYNASLDTGGINIENASLWTNQSGSFVLYNSTTGIASPTAEINYNLSASDGTFDWFIKSCNSDGDCYFSENRTVTVDTTNPSVSITNPGALINFGKPGGNFTLNWTISDANLGSCWYFYNNTNHTVTCANNGISIALDENYKNITMYANDTVGHLGSDNQTFDYKVFQNSITYDSTSYETQTDSYILNISSDGSQSVTAVLYFNGTSYTATKTGNNNEMKFTSTITHAINDVGNKSFYWNVTHGSSVIKTDTSWQSVQNFSLNLCNGTNGMAYINFTFKDEETDTYINSSFSIDDEWEYYLGSDSSVYKSFDFSNTSQNLNYAFCLHNSNDTLHMNSVTFRYYATGYPQRLHTRSSDLTNSTTNQLLYLLATADGQYSSFQIQNEVGSPLSDVSVQVERKFDGSWTVIGLDESDDSGLVTFWVNPNQDHRFTFTKTGYTTQTLTVRPTQSLYTITLSGGTSAPTYSPDYIGINYYIAPLFGSVLTPNTNYVFTYNITSNKSNLDSYSFNLYDESDNLLDTASGSTAAGSNLSIILNTSSYNQIVGKYYFDIGNGSSQITMRTWTVLQVDAGNYSISTWFDNISMEDVDIEGKFTGYFIFFLILFVGVAGLTRATGMELSSPGIALGLVLAVAWIASLGGFFNVAFTPTDFINKYGIALVMTFLCGGFLLGQLRRT